jgi:hypothetical protein
VDSTSASTVDVVALVSPSSFEIIFLMLHNKKELKQPLTLMLTKVTYHHNHHHNHHHHHNHDVMLKAKMVIPSFLRASYVPPPFPLWLLL